MSNFTNRFHKEPENITSAKILNKFLKPVREFFNNDDNCIDRRYELFRILGK
jgi:hypothetical protein